MPGFEAAFGGRPMPALATTYEGGDPALLERLVELVDLLEIAPDTIVGSEQGQYVLRPEVLEEYASVSSRVGLIAHGIGLSIGSFDQWNHDYLRLLDESFARFDLLWHSEHLACTVVAGESLGTMLSMPRTQEALDLVSRRVELLQKLYPVPFLLEHVIQILPDAPAEFTPAGFLNAITSRTGCGLVLDVYNLECDAHNQGLNIPAFLDELNLAAVVEMHLAGGVQYEGFQLDIHSSITRESTVTLACEIVRRAPNLRAVTFEYLKEAVALLGHDAICGELQRLRQTVLSQAVLQ